MRRTGPWAGAASLCALLSLQRERMVDMLPAVSIFALTTYGLETVSAQELEALKGVTVMQTAYRRINANCSGPVTALLGLRTVDDVFVDVATWTGLGRRRDTLARLRAYSAQLDLQGALTICRQARPIGRAPSFAVSASFVGRRNYSVPEIKDALAEGIRHSYDWTYRDDDASVELNIRLFIEHETAYVGVRLGARPLHERSYQQVHRPGALKSSVAAALVAMAGTTPGTRVLDPCCGSGTIVIEAAQRGAVAHGGDIALWAIAAACTNAAGAGVAARFDVADARRLPLAAGTVDRVISNLPWGRQVRVDTALDTFYRRSLAEMARVLAPGGRIVLLTGVPDLAQYSGLRCLQQRQISLCGQRPTIIVCTV